MNYKVYALEKYRKRRKIILCMNVYYSNHMIMQEKVGSEIRDDKKRPIRIRDKHPGSATLEINVSLFLDLFIGLFFVRTRQGIHTFR
jgi:hypothetical protein